MEPYWESFALSTEGLLACPVAGDDSSALVDADRAAVLAISTLSRTITVPKSPGQNISYQ